MKQNGRSNINKRAAALLIGVIMLTTMCGTMLNSCVKTPETEIYLIVPEPNSLMECYIIKTKAGKLIVIDGGIAGQGYEAVPYIKAALRAVAGKKDGEYFEVEAWFLSHAHNDHFNELGKVMREYVKEDNLKINNFYFDFPPYETEEFPYKDGDYPDLIKLKKGFDRYAEVNGIEVPEGKSYYDVLNGAYVNAETIAAGQDIIIDELRFEMMQTWDVSDKDNVNNSSLVFRLYVGDKTILFLHDLGINGGKRLLEKYGDSLKSDYVHMAHHGQAGVSEEVYKAIDADVYLWSTPIWVWTNTTTYRIGETRMWVNNGVDYDTADEHNIVACLYEAYPTDSTSIEAWKKVLPVMRIKID
ncbi:MAG: MBL fold metallo-hydrolase [Clostridia bacterium]|nr:MBL fold metallo-hydrolase [Clostridia bacterium]